MMVCQVRTPNTPSSKPYGTGSILVCQQDPSTVKKCRNLAENHIILDLGARKLHRLSADDVDRWLAKKAKTLSTDTLRQLYSILKRSVARAQARDKVKRNVVLLCEVPQGQEGRPSKALTIQQAATVLDAAAGTAMYTYIVLSLLVGARTEELRPLRWSRVVAYVAELDAWLPVTEVGWEHEKFAIYIWRSVRAKGKTKTKKSRRSLALPKRCVEALRLHQELQARQREVAGKRWQEQDLVFASTVGTLRNANNVLRSFRAVLAKTDLTPEDWTPRELRHSFVSILSDAGVSIEDIARLAGHGGTHVTETVYWHQIRPALLAGAEAMDSVFPAHESTS